MTDAERKLAVRGMSLGIYRWLLIVLTALVGMASFPKHMPFVALAVLLASTTGTAIVTIVLIVDHQAAKRQQRLQAANEYAVTSYFRRIAAGLGDDLDPAGNSQVWEDAHEFAFRLERASITRDVTARDLSGWWGAVTKPRTSLALLGLILGDLIAFSIAAAIVASLAPPF